MDNAKGTINGVPAVQAGYGGSNLGLIDLTLEQTGGKWKVATAQSSTKTIYDTAAKQSLAAIDTETADAVKADHEKVVAYANGAIGTTTAPIHSFFALVQDDPTVEIVTKAQKWYVENYINKNLPQYKDLPILSVGAPFKAGRNGPEEYTEIKAGPLAIRSAGDLYLYDNTLKAIQVKGSVIKEWLEMSAGKFNTIDPGKTEEQPLLNDAFPVYNFDVIDGVTYQYDVTKPAKYAPTGALVDAAYGRVVNLEYNGKPLDPDQDFIFVTNNYRASGGGNFPGVKDSKYIIDSTEENRQILMDYITANKTINPSVDHNWSLAPIGADINVTFTSSPKAEAYATAGGSIAYTGTRDAKGFGVFKLDLHNGSAATPGKGFTDAPATHWASRAISELTDKGIVSGKTATTFEPNANVTRAEFARLLVKALGLKATKAAPFSDVKASAWYASDVAAAYESGLVNGVGGGRFAPATPVTREEMAVMAAKALKAKSGAQALAGEPSGFADAASVSAWAQSGVAIDRATGDVVAKKGEIVDVKRENIAPDAEIAAMIEELEAKNAPVLQAAIGQTKEALTRTANASGESALGNLIADGMREAMKSDFAFMNSGGIRNDIPQGNVTYGDMFSVQPFGNVLIKMTLTGAQVKTMLEQQWSGTSPKIGQVSGFTYKYDDSKPTGSKVVELKKADGAAIDDKSAYTMVVNDFMATGGDGYVVLKDGTNREAGAVDLDATIAYLKAKFGSAPIEAEVEGRFAKVN